MFLALKAFWHLFFGSDLQRIIVYLKYAVPGVCFCFDSVYLLTLGFILCLCFYSIDLENSDWNLKATLCCVYSVFEEWTVLASDDLDEFACQNLKNVSDWERNIRAAKARSKDFEKLSEWVLPHNSYWLYLRNNFGLCAQNILPFHSLDLNDCS